MLRFILSFLVGAIAAAIVAAIIVGNALSGWWRAPLASTESADAFLEAAIEKLDTESKGNVAFVLLDEGKPVGDFYKSKGVAVNADTQFQVASLSKWISAWGVMTLVQSGEIDLDAPVSTYLTRWSLPESEFDNNEVTVRRLLSHTAGLTDGLGYGGFAPGEPVQRLEESLTRAADASPGKEGVVRVGIEPGSAFEYSGGGYTLLQLIIEEVSGQSFNDYMQAAVFEPLGMTRSTYVLDENAQNVAEIFGENGGPAIHYRFASLAAASLYTTSNDMVRFIQAHQTAGADNTVLSEETLREMRKGHASQLGAEIWGLGVILYAENNQGDYIIGHDGNNEPAINTAVRFDPADGGGVVVLETGNKLLATELAGEWVFWKTGNVDSLTVIAESGETLRSIYLGGGVAFLIAFILGWRIFRRKGKTRASA